MKKITIEKIEDKWNTFCIFIKNTASSIFISIEKQRYFLCFLLTLIFFFVAFAHSPFLTLARGTDPWIFFLGGKIQAEGGHLYVDFFDHKGPIIHWLNEFGYILTKNLWGIWGIEFLILFIGVILCFCGICRRNTPLFAFWVCLSLICLNDTPLYPESFAYDFTILGIGLILLSPRKMITWFILGILGACVFFIKQTCIGFYAAVGVYLLLEVRSFEYRKYLYSYMAGGVLCSVFILGTLACQHELTAYYECCFLFNIWYASYAPLPFVVNLGWLFQMKFIYFLLMFFSACSLLTCKTLRYSGKVVLCMLFYFLWEFVFVAKGGRLWDYQFVGLELSMLILILYCLHCFYPEMTAKKLTAIFYLLTFAIFSFLGGAYLSDKIPLKYTLNLYNMAKGKVAKSDSEKIAEYVNTFPKCNIQIWGSGYEIYAYTGRKSIWAPYYYHFPLFYMRPDKKQFLEMKKKLIKSYPSIIIDGVAGMPKECLSGSTKSPSPLLQLLRDFIQERYVLAPVKGAGMNVYIPKEWADCELRQSK